MALHEFEIAGVYFKFASKCSFEIIRKQGRLQLENKQLLIKCRERLRRWMNWIANQGTGRLVKPGLLNKIVDPASEGLGDDD